MNAELYLELLREAHLAAIQRGATLTGGTRLGLGERIDDDMQFNTQTGFQDTPGTYSVPSESRELNVFADAALAEMKVGLTRQELVGVLVNQFNIPRSNLVYAWDIPTHAVMRDSQRQTELEPEFFTGNPLDPTSKGPMQHSTYRPNNWWAGRQGKDVSGATRPTFDTATGMSGSVAQYPDAEGPIYKHTNPFIANSAVGWGIEAALSAVLSPTGLKAGKRLLGPLVRAMPELPPRILARFKGVARNPDEWVSPHAKPFDYEADIGRAAEGPPGTPTGAPTGRVGAPGFAIEELPEGTAASLGKQEWTLDGTQSLSGNPESVVFDNDAFEIVGYGPLGESFKGPMHIQERLRNADYMPDPIRVVMLRAKRSGPGWQEGDYIQVQVGYLRETGTPGIMDPSDPSRQLPDDITKEVWDRTWEGFDIGSAVRTGNEGVPTDPQRGTQPWGNIWTREQDPLSSRSWPQYRDMGVTEAHWIGDQAAQHWAFTQEFVDREYPIVQRYRELQGIADAAEGPPGTPDPKAESSLFAESLSASELTPEAMEQAIREHYTTAWESMTPRDRASWQQMGRMSAPDDLDGYLDGMVDNIVGDGTPLDPAIGWGNLPEGVERRAHEIASEGTPGTPTGDVPPVHSQRGAFDQDSEFDQVVASLWEEMDRIRGELPQGPIDPTRGGFRPHGFEDGTKSADRTVQNDGAGGGGEPPRRNNIFDGDFSYDGWDEERLLNRQAEIIDGADAGRWELTDEADNGFLLYVEHFNIENELRIRRGQQPLPNGGTAGMGSMHDAASRDEYFEWLAETEGMIGGGYPGPSVFYEGAALDDLDRHLNSVWEQMLGETDPSSLSFTDALKSLGSGAAIAGATAVTAQTLFPEQVEKVVSGLATFNDGWWSWIKEFPEHLDWVVRATGATLDGMEQGTRSMGSPVLDGLSDGFREEAGGWMGSLGGGAVPVMGRQDASMLKGLSKDLSEQGHNGQAMFPNDIRREIENGDAMIVGYRSDADYQRAVEESGQYGIEVDRHFWRKPNRKNIRPAEGQPWTSDNLKKLAATNYFYPDAGLRRGPR